MCLGVKGTVRRTTGPAEQWGRRGDEASQGLDCAGPGGHSEDLALNLSDVGAMGERDLTQVFEGPLGGARPGSGRRALQEPR